MPFVAKGLQGRVGQRLYIFVAGHGFSDPKDLKTTGLYTANAQDLFAFNVGVTAYAEWFRRHAVFDEIVLIMDCCRTINPLHVVSQPPLPSYESSPRADRIRWFYAFASGPGQESQALRMAPPLRERTACRIRPTTG